MKVLTKELARKLAARNNTSITEASRSLASVISVVREEVAKGNPVRLTDLGTIYPFKANARKYRDPISGGLKSLNPRIRLKIKASEGFIRMLNEE